MADNNVVIKVEQVTKSFRTTQSSSSFFWRLFPIWKNPEILITALDEISLDIQHGEFISIIGPSGCGKTTLLRIIHGLVKPDAGQVLINDDVVTRPQPECGFVFQNFGLYPWRSVMENVAFGLEIENVNRAERKERSQEFINLVGLEGFESHYPHQLSGGMQQRVGLARTLAIDPQILLMDEPFGALDAQTKRIMQLELLRILQTQSNISTIVFVTHDLEEALLLSDKVVVMTQRPGRVKEIVEVPFPRPRDESIMDTSKFIDLRRHLWDTLREEQSGAS